ncbi:serine hydrolase [Nesterenkonia xinjiangensis]|uniref:Beta-lactamase class A n=1 Tax=Nesterenkonia xinjiangensis TaxID=225327 RepID=A0A7Z0GNG5_9MICC|nr:serine hydrolase [Nesterenkonia xinjiangensis]NYJ79120.1 beta-lactamase class A [Nesterenkonia xinjiangensis]
MKTPGQATSLEQRIRALTTAQPFAVHWEIRDLSSKNSVTIGNGADVQVASFSTRKVSVLLVCLTLVQHGKLSLDQRLPITAEMAEGVQAGIMKDLAAGVELSLEDHLRQMMITSDNICTQLVFDAIGAAAEATSLHQDDRAAAALQQVNDYCAWIGMRATLHREIFPRSGDLTWHHSIEATTVTTAADQAHLLAQLGRGTQGTEAAELLHLTPELCRFAVELMRGLYTPLLGAETIALRFGEKNGRGLRSLSQVGLATTDDGAPVAAVAVFAESIPTQLPDGTPGRIAAYELFGQIGQTIEAWHLGERQPEPRQLLRLNPHQDLGATDAQLEAVMSHQGVLAASGGVTDSDTTYAEIGRDVVSNREFHPLAGSGKFLAALALAQREAADPGLLEASVTLTAEHRRRAAVGPLHISPGSGQNAGTGQGAGQAADELTLSLHDALGLIIRTSDAATSLAVRDALEARGVDLLAETRGFLERFNPPGQTLIHTQITGFEDWGAARGDLLTGETSPHELRQLLMLVTGYGGLLGEELPDRGEPLVAPSAASRMLGWMSPVFEPAGLAWALPGYGPKKVPQWTVSGLETRGPRTPAADGASDAHDDADAETHPEGWTSVLITRRPGVEPTQGGVLWMAAYVPAGPTEAAPEAPTRTGRDAARIFGELGLTLHRRGLSRAKLRGSVAPMYISDS